MCQARRYQEYDGKQNRHRICSPEAYGLVEETYWLYDYTNYNDNIWQVLLRKYLALPKVR